MPVPASEPVKRPANPPIKPPAKQDRTTVALLLVAAFVAVGGVGFAIGHVTAGSGSAAPTSALAGRGGQGGFGGFGRNVPSLAPGETLNPAQFGGGRTGGLGGIAGGVTGTVQSVTPTSITIQEASGTSVTIDLSGTTTYHGETSASSGDVKVGTSVTVQIDTSAIASERPNPSASGALGGRTLTAKDILITNP
jgi:preprotein translocase subunit YajC